MRRSPLHRHTPLRARTVPLRRSPLAARSNAVPAVVRAAVKRRAQGWCEACGEAGPEHLHHRKRRSQGGRHEPANLLHVHAECHREIHANPARAYALGLLVRSCDDPVLVPVRMFGEGFGEILGLGGEAAASGGAA